MERDISFKSNIKKGGIAILILAKVDFRVRNITEINRGVAQ